jgi:hypothetical protein
MWNSPNFNKVVETPVEIGKMYGLSEEYRDEFQTEL